MMVKEVASKWSKTEVLKRDPKMAKHLPEMRRFTQVNVREMLQRYNRVVAKPTKGTGGKGLILIIKQGKTSFTVHYQSNVRRFNSQQGMLRFLDSIRKGRPYLLQRAIQLATIQGRPVDYRAKIVAGNGRWHIRALVARVARKGLFVTNLCKGGYMLGSREALRRSLGKSLVRRKRIEMRELTFRGVECLEKQFPGIGQLGFDYGIDRSGKVWIFEVNTRPL
jgi:hypothetical protein